MNIYNYIKKEGQTEVKTDLTWTARETELQAMKARRDLLNKEIEELKALLTSKTEERGKLSKDIHGLSTSIRQHKNSKDNPLDKSGVLVYQMFGKKLKELTPDEYREYYNARQRANRAKRKAGKEG